MTTGAAPPFPRVAKAPITGKRQSLTHLAVLILLSPRKPRPAFAGARGAPPPVVIVSTLPCPSRPSAPCAQAFSQILARFRQKVGKNLLMLLAEGSEEV